MSKRLNVTTTSSKVPLPSKRQSTGEDDGKIPRRHPEDQQDPTSSRNWHQAPKRMTWLCRCTAE